MKHKCSCSRCVNDWTVKKITFNEEALCSHCTCYDRYRPTLEDYDRLEKLFLKKISGPGRIDYDAAVGFSGGKDSTALGLEWLWRSALEPRRFKIFIEIPEFLYFSIKSVKEK